MMTRSVLIPSALLLAAVWAAGVDVSTLGGESAARLLDRRFPEPQVSWILMDANTGRVSGMRWNEPKQPVPAGSLVKPFTALAYAGANGNRYPAHTCTGESSGCWLPRGHGRQNIIQAVANSCNSYFRKLAAGVTAAQVSAAASRFGLMGPLEGVDPATLIGMGDGWRLAPSAIARAYCELARRAAEPGAGDLLRGMAQCARTGTGSAIGAGALAKTGTAPCVHRPRTPGDGYAIALYPAERPVTALLVQLHGAPGSQAAAVAGRMLRAIREGR